MHINTMNRSTREPRTAAVLRAREEGDDLWGTDGVDHGDLYIGILSPFPPSPFVPFSVPFPLSHLPLPSLIDHPIVPFPEPLRLNAR